MIRGLLQRAVRDPAWGEWGRGDDISMGGNTAAGVSVTTDSGTRFSTIYSCLTLRGETLMAMPVDAVVADGGVRRPVPAQPWMASPNPDVMWWPTFIDQCMWSLDTDGNCFLLPTRDRMGRVVELWVLDPAKVTVRRDGIGPRTYWIDGQPARQEILHVAIHMPAGTLRGINAIQHCAESVGAAVAAQVFGSTWFGNSAMPSVVLEMGGMPTIEQQREMRQSWFRHHGGVRRANLPAVLVGGQAKVLNLSPEQSQFLETRRFSVADLCGLWKVPVEMLNFGSDASGTVYQNLDKLKLRFLQQSLLAPMRLFELVFGSLLPPGQQFKFNPDSWLRADTTVRYNAHAVGLGSGFLTVDEVRALEDLPPLPNSDDLASVREMTEMIQKIYLGVGVVITAEEAREILNRAGADLEGLPDGLAGRGAQP